MKKEKKNTRDHPLQVYCKTCGKLVVEVEADWYQFNWYYAPKEIRPPLRELFPGITHEQFLGLSAVNVGNLRNKGFAFSNLGYYICI